jgi:hypothetical protein
VCKCITRTLLSILVVADSISRSVLFFVRVHHTYIAENECAGKSEGDKWRDETETDGWRGERRGERRLSETGEKNTERG